MDLAFILKSTLRMEESSLVETLKNVKRLLRLTPEDSILHPTEANLSLSTP